MQTKARERSAQIVGAVLGLLGLCFLVAAVWVWFTGGDQWKVWGIKVRLNEWEKPWAIGTALWMVRGLVAWRPFLVIRQLVRLAVKIFRPAGLSLDLPARRWQALGLIVGAAGGALFSIHYYYLVPHRGLQIAATLLAAAVSVFLHWWFFLAREEFFKKFLPGVSEDRRAAVSHGVYWVIWAILIAGPGKRWEARLTEPVYGQGAAALLIALFLCWLVLADWRRSGWAGRARRAAAYGAVVIAVLASVFSWRAESGSGGARPRDRVILFTLDTTRADHLSGFGYSRKTSPNLDRLADSGVRFTMAFTPMGTTDPAHASILTGAYPRTHGLENFHKRITGQVSSLAEVFRDHGYQTIALTSRETLLPSDLGLPGFALMSGPKPWAIQTSAFEAYRRFANALLQNRNRDLFIWVHLFDPHHPYEPHPGYSEPFLPVNKGAVSGNSFLEPGERYTPEEIQYRIDLYDGEIFYMDYWFGRMLALARSLTPVPERPVFAVAIADHGEAMGEYQDRPLHYGFGHGGMLYNAVMHVPLIISWPGLVPANRRVGDITESIDLAPTMIEYLFPDAVFKAQGASLKPVIEGRARTDGRAVMQRYTIDKDKYRPYMSLPQYALIRDHLKLFHTIGGGDELYDLGADFREEFDLSASWPELVKQLTPVLDQWLKDTPAAKPEAGNYSPAEINRLRALGYIK